MLLAKASSDLRLCGEQRCREPHTGSFRHPTGYAIVSISSFFVTVSARRQRRTVSLRLTGASEGLIFVHIAECDRKDFGVLPFRALCSDNFAVDERVRVPKGERPAFEAERFVDQNRETGHTTSVDNPFLTAAATVNPKHFNGTSEIVSSTRAMSFRVRLRHHPELFLSW